jgi:hypothetical protein
VDLARAYSTERFLAAMCPDTWMTHVHHKRDGYATMIGTERRLRMGALGHELVVEWCKLANGPQLWQAVAGKLRLDRSFERMALVEKDASRKRV